MPVTFDTQNNVVSLRDYIAGGANVRSFPSLNDDQRIELAAKRIEMQPDYEIGAIGAGIVGGERAADEVRSKSKLGRKLAQIEMRMITHLIEEAEKSAKATKRKPKG